MKSPPSIRASTASCWSPRATAASRGGASATRRPGRRRTDLDFNLWLGPAPDQPYHGNLVHYNWHWFWDFGNGDIGNQGIHEMDVARWAIKGATLPTKVWSLGGRFAYEDQGQTPNTQMAVFEYGDALLVFEVRGLVDKPEDSPFKFKVANEYYTTDGMITDGKFYPKHGGAARAAGSVRRECHARRGVGQFPPCRPRP